MILAHLGNIIASMNTPLTILIHGLHLNPWYMKPLAKKLENHGLSTYCYGYKSLNHPIAKHSQGLHEYLLTHHDPAKPINLVGHSLGGLVIRHFLVHYPIWQVHRCVTLGTPHQGSQTAHFAHKYLPPLIKQSYTGALDGTCPLPPSDVEFGVIAGHRPVGLGVPLLALYSYQCRHDRLDRRHDGTVLLSETTLDHATDYLVLPVSHSGLLTDKTVAMQTLHFLQHGQFNHA